MHLKAIGQVYLAENSLHNHQQHGNHSPHTAYDKPFVVSQISSWCPYLRSSSGTAMKSGKRQTGCQDALISKVSLEFTRQFSGYIHLENVYLHAVLTLHINMSFDFTPYYTTYSISSLSSSNMIFQADNLSFRSHIQISL